MRFLIDGNGGGQSGNFFDVRFLHSAEKLSGVGGQTFNVASLAFGKNGIKSQTRFARAGKSGKDDHFVPRNFQIDIF